MVVSTSDRGKCRVKSCKCKSELLFYGAGVCEKHWSKHCNPKDRFDLKKEFKLKVKE